MQNPILRVVEAIVLAGLLFALVAPIFTSSEKEKQSFEQPQTDRLAPPA